MEDFPRGPAGKVILSEIKGAVAARHAESSVKSHHGSVAERVVSVASELFKTPGDQIKRSFTPLEIGEWTSLAHVEFLLYLEQEFELKLEPRDIMRIASIGAAIDVVEEHMA